MSGINIDIYESDGYLYLNGKEIEFRFSIFSRDSESFNKEIKASVDERRKKNRDRIESVWPMVKKIINSYFIVELSHRIYEQEQPQHEYEETRTVSKIIYSNRLALYHRKNPDLIKDYLYKDLNYNDLKSEDQLLAVAVALELANKKVTINDVDIDNFFASFTFWEEVHPKYGKNLELVGWPYYAAPLIFETKKNVF